ncbi:cytidine deaminase [Metallosphaera tengchongensis]|uniref:cytidine deaminase n=1 Tax=Metallosphaera tengchongensis TaxID=1532350 RepID=A0A6N0NVH3_9CREN|nr:cytidine deaminase [Metallosphaera tengchongensis]QKQ99842.1 cytidine deaminase [Metallosphaera tengchongensis]
MPVIDPSDEELLNHAKRIAKNSYSPFSGLKVGAAILTENGEVIVGTNIENSSYGLSICAERVAVFNAVTRGLNKFKKIAISLENGKGIMPCGACRQVLAEFSKDVIVVTRNNNGDIIEYKLNELLPESFSFKR